jgi:8-oxo-dGTP diphosphatase
VSLQPHSPPEQGLAAFTVVVPHQGGRLLLLRRAAWKKRFPGRWTGIGGRVEPDELDGIPGSALRELREETGLTAGDLVDLTLRRTLTFRRSGEPTTCLFFFTAGLRSDRIPPCNEGELTWVAPADLPSLDVIETAGAVLPQLVEDLGVDRPVRHGAARYDGDGRLAAVVWA